MSIKGKINTVGVEGDGTTGPFLGLANADGFTVESFVDLDDID